MSDNDIRKALLGLCKGLEATGNVVMSQTNKIKKMKKQHLTLATLTGLIVVAGYKAFKEVNTRLTAIENALVAMNDEWEDLLRHGGKKNM